MHKMLDGKYIHVPSGRNTRWRLGLTLELVVLKSAQGYYLGTWDESGPVARESVEYWDTESEAREALITASTEDQKFTQNWSI